MNFRKGQDPFSLKNVGDALRPDQAIVAAAEEILKGTPLPDALRSTHVENGMDKANDLLGDLSEETKGETRLRILMSQRALLDAMEQHEAEQNA